VAVGAATAPASAVAAGAAGEAVGSGASAAVADGVLPPVPVVAAAVAGGTCATAGVAPRERRTK
jgi:hypothetical protein